ncbi:hypothetical protein GCM10009304_13610 [Pseudomonas matsuisoli]|uniref:DUF3253 domain-containing protein n=2 Tax=Pseudomonas matsuisoli TaxID=1515666 RepID=A0A917UVX6_9PSED|nr:hypothetical protein GCM10009304_13610 [Pseudomonas matsuisoli]
MRVGSIRRTHIGTNVYKALIDMTCSKAVISRCIRELLEVRTAEASICPSDVARSLEADGAAWRALMPAVREVGRQLADNGFVQITQAGKVLAPTGEIRGPIRLRRGPNYSRWQPG